MDVFRLKVTIIGIPKLYRTIDISGNCTFDDLHAVIFKAFDRYDPHLFSFFMSGKGTNSIRRIYDAPEITHPQNVDNFMDFGGKKLPSAAGVRLNGVPLEDIGIFHYLFDFGDNWWHRIRVMSVREEKGRKKIREIVKSVGDSPPQYPEFEDYDEEDDD